MLVSTANRGCMFHLPKLFAALLCPALIGAATDLQAHTPQAPEPVVTEDEAPDEARVFPEFGLHLMGARYAPTEDDLHWTSWIGGSLSVFRIRQTIVYGSAEVETLAGNTRRGIDATQAAYQLEIGLRHRHRDWLFEGFFHHVSRHLIDRKKESGIDWNVMGLRALKQIPRGLGVPVRAGASFGYVNLASVVGYKFILTGRIDADLWEHGDAGVYLRMAGRLVTVEPEEPFLRGDFVDLWIETGGRLARGKQLAELYVAYERRNDVYLDQSAKLDRALLGIRFGVGDAASLAGLQGGFGPSPRLPRAE